jgi:WXXGXW repeat (2 copies)
LARSDLIVLPTLRAKSNGCRDSFPPSTSFALIQFVESTKLSGAGCQLPLSLWSGLRKEQSDESVFLSCLITLGSGHARNSGREPGDGYICVPGYWAYGDDDYYSVPGTWVLAPEPGLLWTPGYWGWSEGVSVFHEGYWGPHVGFYGGINYGFGYFGVGFEGGRWDSGRFFTRVKTLGLGKSRMLGESSRVEILVYN